MRLRLPLVCHVRPSLLIDIAYRMCSMTFGRPPLLPNAYMQIELPTEAELEELAGDSLVLSQPSLVPTSSLLRATA